MIREDNDISIMRVKREEIFHERVINSETVRNVLDKTQFNPLVGTTPTVTNHQEWLSHAASTTVTNFLGGKDGHHLYILGNGNTTLTNGTNIFTNTGANKVLAANRMYHLVCYNNLWYEV